MRATQAINGFHSVALLLETVDATAAILEDVFRFVRVGQEGAVTRYGAKGDAPGSIIDLQAAVSFARGSLGGGSLHHIAFRAGSDPEQAAMIETITKRQRNRDDRAKRS